MSRYGPADGGYPPAGDPYGEPPDAWAAGGYGGQPPYREHAPYGGQGGPDDYGSPPPAAAGRGSAWRDLTSPQPPPPPDSTSYLDYPTAAQPVYRDDARDRRHDGPWEHPPPPRRRRTLLVGLLVVALLLVVGGGVLATLSWVASGEAEPDTTAVGPVGPTGTPQPQASEEPDDEPADPQARIGMSAAVVEPDDCMVNDGTDLEPEMRIIDCDDPEQVRTVYRVLTRFDEPIEGETEQEWDQAAQQLCAEEEEYEVHYRFVADNQDDSFVLCMVEQ